MEKLYKNILTLLAEDARYSAKKIATMLSVKEDAVQNAIAELETKGAIAGYSAIINNEKLDDSDYVEALIEIKAIPQRSTGFDAIAQQICKFTEVKSLYLMSGGFDLAVLISGKNLKAVAMFVAEKLSLIDNITATATHFILKKYKIEGIITDSGEKSKRMPFNYEL